jgi:hypothetical protein
MSKSNSNEDKWIVILFLGLALIAYGADLIKTYLNCN